MDSTTNATVQKIVKIFDIVSDELGLDDIEIDIMHMRNFVCDTISAVIDLVDNEAIPYKMGTEAVFFLTKISKLDSSDDIKIAMEEFNIAYQVELLQWKSMKRMLQPSLHLAAVLGANVTIYVDLLCKIEEIPEDFQMPAYEQLFTRVVD